jgi:hypothetical protein
MHHVSQHFQSLVGRDAPPRWGGRRKACSASRAPELHALLCRHALLLLQLEEQNLFLLVPRRLLRRSYVEGRLPVAVGHRHVAPSSLKQLEPSREAVAGAAVGRKPEPGSELVHFGTQLDEKSHLGIHSSGVRQGIHSSGVRQGIRKGDT